jgi:hypothetical protein
MGFLEIGSQELFAGGWLQTLILLISASWVARITNTSHQCPIEKRRPIVLLLMESSFLHLKALGPWSLGLCFPDLGKGEGVEWN